MMIFVAKFALAWFGIFTVMVGTFHVGFNQCARAALDAAKLTNTKTLDKDDKENAWWIIIGVTMILIGVYL